MNATRALAVVIMAACVTALPAISAECTITEDAQRLDPVAVGFCESDAVFVGKVDARFETVRAFTPDGEAKTKHYRIETSTIRVLDSYKNELPSKVAMIADLYDKKSGAFSFENGKEYLVFAKRLAGENEYAGASAACSVQPTMLLADARQVRERLDQHRKGIKKIDCKNIAAK